MTSTPVFPSTIRGLLKVPREMLHLVLDDLPVSYVLSLSCKNVPYIDECIIGHIHYKNIFRTIDELHSIRDYFILYAKIATARSMSIHKSLTILTYHPPHHHLTHDLLENSLHTTITWFIKEITRPTGYFDALSRFSKTPLTEVWDSSTLSLQEGLWNDLSAASLKMNEAKSQQMQRIHDILASNPLILKAQRDPSQESRANAQHILSRLKWHSEQLLRPRWGLGSGRLYRLGERFIPIPYNRFLNLFLKVLERYPLPDKDMPGVSLPFKNHQQKELARRVPMSLGPEDSKDEDYEEEELEEKEFEVSEANSQIQRETGGSKPTRKWKYLYAPNPSYIQQGLHHTYTPEAVQKIRKAILGLKYVYKLAPADPERIPRTKYTPYSVHPNNFAAGFSQPCFLPRDNDEKKIYLLPEKELEWLEAFVWSCEYMKNMDARYNLNITVCDLWKRYENL